MKDQIANVDSYAVGMAVLLVMFLICAGLCYRRMNNNRGNFINLPAWRKAVRIVMNLLLYVLLGRFLWRENPSELGQAFLTIICILLVIGAICFAVWYIQTGLRRNIKRRRGRWTADEESEPILSTSGIPKEYEYVWNQMVLEYIVYAVCWLAKGLIIAIIAVLAGWQAAGKLWQISDETWEYVGSCIMLPLRNCLYLCFVTAVMFSVAFMLLVMMVERTREDAELEQKKRDIRRRFQSNEHGV